PIGAPSCGNIPYQARRPGGAFSIASRTAPPHSPPSPRPWPKRQIASSSGAARPIVAYVGSVPIATVEIPIVSSAATSVVLRPMRSPKWPKTAEPIGRATKAIAKVASDARTAVAGSEEGKNRRGETSTAGVEEKQEQKQ